jgi:hypothetical protein
MSNFDTIEKNFVNHFKLKIQKLSRIPLQTNKIIHEKNHIDIFNEETKVKRLLNNLKFKRKPY